MKTHKKRKTKNKSKKKNNHQMIVHQIFYNIGKGELKDIPRFYECYQNNIKKCKNQKITYKLWNRSSVEKLLKKE